MNNTAEVYLWGTRIGIIHEVSSCVNHFEDYARNVGIQERTVQTIKNVIEINKVKLV